MRKGSTAFLLLSIFGMATGVGDSAGAGTIALKSGEALELGNVYYVINCKSQLKATPEAEMIEGPPQVSVAIKEGMVLPRWQRCAKKVPGGTIVITAKEIEDPSLTSITVRVIYKTKDGERKSSHVYNLQLLP